jgi:hypothetical protein
MFCFLVFSHSSGTVHGLVLHTQLQKVAKDNIISTDEMIAAIKFCVEKIPCSTVWVKCTHTILSGAFVS